MILLDTNVISEVMRPEPALAVIQWLNSVDSAMLHLSVISIGEIEYGLRCLPEGKRREDLEARFADFVQRAFPMRVLAYDEQAARHYGAIMAERRHQGRPMSAPDGQIAAVARSHDMAVATRNLADFDGLGLDLINARDST